MLGDGEIRKYDQQGRPVEFTEVYGKKTYFKNGMPVEERDGNGGLISRTTYRHDPGGRIVEAVKQARGGTESKVFDQAGNVVQITDIQGIKIFSKYSKNDKGQTVGYYENDLATGQRSTVELNPLTGEVQKRVDPYGNVTFFNYMKDENGEVKESREVSNRGGEVRKFYEKGQLVAKEENGLRSVYENEVNPEGMLVRTREVQNTPTQNGMLQKKIERRYDESGKVIYQRDDEGIREYAYESNEQGQVKKRIETITRTDGSKSVIVYAYDDEGREIEKNENGQRTVKDYEIDAESNITGIREMRNVNFAGEEISDSTSKKMDEQGRVTQETDAFGTVTTHRYDEKGNRIVSVNKYTSTIYVYDEFGNMLESAETNYKGTVYTHYDPKTKLPVDKTFIKNNGVVDYTSFSWNTDGKRTSYTIENLGYRNTVYRDREGRQAELMIYAKKNGKMTTTTYRYEGDFLVSSEEIADSGITHTLYNVQGRAKYSERLDQWGRDYATFYTYTDGRLTSSVEEDKKGKTITFFDGNEEAFQIERFNTIGFPRYSLEKRAYQYGILTSSVSTDAKGKTTTEFDENGLASTLHRENLHGFPREHWVKNTCDDGGDIASSLQTDNRGKTENLYDTDGLMIKSIRYEKRTFPRVKETSYEYSKGELLSNQEKDDRGETFSSFNADGLMTYSRRTKYYGYPRVEESIYKYDSNGYLVFSVENDENGFSDNYYSIDEVVVLAYRENKYGHAREQWTQNFYDDLGYIILSKENDLRGTTLTQYDQDSLPIENLRNDLYGVLYSRDTLTLNRFDSEGFMTESESKNSLSTSKRYLNSDNLVVRSQQIENLGLNWSRLKTMDEYVYDDHGRIQSNMEYDKLGTTYSEYDINGDPVFSRRENVTGIGATRETITNTTFEKDTGMPAFRMLKNTYSTSTVYDFDERTGLERKQQTCSNFGLLATRETETDVELDERHGLSRKTEATNAYGKTTTYYDTLDGCTYGVAVKSESSNHYGIFATRAAETDIEADTNTGLNRKTLSINAYGTTETLYDTTAGGTYGLAIRSVSEANFGLVSTRHTETEISSNAFNGLNTSTLAENDYGATFTEYESEETGIALRQVSDADFGLLSTRHTETEIDADPYSGLNKKTVATNAYGTTTTYYDTKERTGVANLSEAVNNYGLLSQREQKTEIQANPYSGLNTQTKTANGYGTTLSHYADMTTGTIQDSLSQNNYGLGATRLTQTQYETNLYNGLNSTTQATHAYGTTTTRYDDEQTGLAESSHAENTYGLIANRVVDTEFIANAWTGLNVATEAVSAHGTTWTEYDSESTGVAERSVGQNNFGLWATRQTMTEITANAWNGLNEETMAVNGYGSTRTHYDGEAYGIAETSESMNRFGVLSGREVATTIESDTWSGLNKETVAVSGYGSTTTEYHWEGAGASGVAISSASVNRYGLGAVRDVATAIEANAWNGLNIRTEAQSAFGLTRTEYEEEQTGVAESAHAENNYGLKAGRVVDMEISANVWNGLNEMTSAVSAYGSVTTEFESENYGVAEFSAAVNHFGLVSTRSTATEISANVMTGLNDSTVAVNAYGTTATEYDGATSGVATQSYGENNFGIGAARASSSAIDANTWNGNNETTLNQSAYGTTWTAFDAGDTGVATFSRTTNQYGLGATRETGTLIDANTWNGLNRQTLGSNAYAATLTMYDDENYGVAEQSRSLNHFGLLATRLTDTDIAANVVNGLHEKTEAWNAFGMTTTCYDSGAYGTATRSTSSNYFGLGSTRESASKFEVNQWTGLTRKTESSSAYGQTISRHDDQDTGVVQSSEAVNNYGLLSSRNVATAFEVNTWNGLNQRSVAESGYGRTETLYDAEIYGVAIASETQNHYGLGAARQSHSDIRNNVFNGLGEQSVSDSSYSHSTVYYDTLLGGTYGVAVASHNEDHYGLLAARNTDSAMNVNTWTGLNKQTIAANAYGLTRTDYQDQTTGVAYYSTGLSNFGLTSGRATETLISANETTGLNRETLATNLQATTQTEYDDARFGTAKASASLSNFGLLSSRLTSTQISANSWNGLNEQTVADNAYGKTTTEFDSENYGIAEHSVSITNYGLGATRNSNTQIQASVYNGLNESTYAQNGYGSTYTAFDTAQGGTCGLAVLSESFNNYGLLLARHCLTAIDQNAFSGLNKSTLALSEYGQTYNAYDDQAYGINTYTETLNYYGLGATRQSHSEEIRVNVSNGLNEYTRFRSDYGMNESWYHTSGALGSFGMVDRTHALNNYGLGATRDTISKLTVNTANGLTKESKAEKAYGATYTLSDDQNYGTALYTRTDNYYGIGAARNSWSTAMQVSNATGLNEYSAMQNAYGITETWYTPGSTYGEVDQTRSRSNHGLEYTRDTATEVEANTWNGLNRATMAINTYGATYTEYESDAYGTATHSKAISNYGLLASRFSHSTQMAVDRFNGLNTFSEMASSYGLTRTWYTQDSYGVADRTQAQNNFGLYSTRLTDTDVQVHTWNGLTTRSISNNDYGVTETQFDDQATGVARNSKTENRFGIGATQSTTTQLDVNPKNGLNRSSQASNAYGTTFTNYDAAATGVAEYTLTENQFGLHANRRTETWLRVNVYNGLNVESASQNNYGVTLSRYDGEDSGVIEGTTAFNNYGVLNTRQIHTDITANKTTGLNQFSTASNANGTTVTRHDDWTTGLANYSQTTNAFGLGANKITTTDNYVYNTWTGLTRETTSHNDYGQTITHYRSETTGVAYQSAASTRYGVLAGRETQTAITTNETNGLTRQTDAANNYGRTVTTYDDQSFGIATQSESWGNFGLLATRHTLTDILADPNNGQNIETVARNDYGSTLTHYKNQSDGTAYESFQSVNVGLLSARNTYTSIQANPHTGLNQTTLSANAYGSTNTLYDANYGLAYQSDSSTNYGLGGGRKTRNYIQAEANTGLNRQVTAVNTLATTFSTYESQSYGTVQKAIANNNYGLYGSRQATTEYTVNATTGLNIQTVAFTNNGKTTASFDDEYGLPTTSISENYSGPTKGRVTTSRITSDHWTGVNLFTSATNDLAEVETEYDGDYGVATRAATQNKYGALYSREVDTLYDVDRVTGLNRQTYSKTKLAETWTQYDSTFGAQTEAVVSMTEGLTPNWGRITQYYYDANTTTGTLNKSTALNRLGKNTTDYDSNGLAKSSEYLANYGATYRTWTDIITNITTGQTEKNMARSYSRKNNQETAYSETKYDQDGLAYFSDTTSQYGNYDSRLTHTHITTDRNNGNKIETYSWNSLSNTSTKFNSYGVETYSKNTSFTGVTDGRITETRTTDWSKDTGIKRGSYSENGLSKSYSYFDENGLPTGHYQDREILNPKADGDRIESVEAGATHWSGNPEMTLVTTDITARINYFNEDGQIYKTRTSSKFAANGDQDTTTTYDLNKGNGNNRYSKTEKSNGESTENWYDEYYNVATSSKTHTKEDGDQNTTFQFDTRTGNNTSSFTEGKDGYKKWGEEFDSRGRNTAATVEHDSKKGKKKVSAKYKSNYEYNDWTGLIKTEYRHTIKNSDDETIHYDAHGVKTEDSGSSWMPTGQIKHITEYSGKDSQGNPTSAIRYLDTSMTVSMPSLVARNGVNGVDYMPLIANITYHDSKYLSQASMTYTLDDKDPVAAKILDNKGIEEWTIRFDYSFGAVKTRRRTNYGGSTFAWEYPDDSFSNFHPSANIAYTEYMGVHDGKGQEIYNASGILVQRSLKNEKTQDEIINFENDGKYVTLGYGTREDGSHTYYAYTGMNDIVTSWDDKGVTSFDPSTYHRQSTSGKLGTFTYSYDGDEVIAIKGNGRRGHMEFDKYWNLTRWRDRYGVEHFYTSLQHNKGFVTQAKESFTDRFGGNWSGTANFDSWGTYYTGGRLQAYQARFDQPAAANIGAPSLDVVYQNVLDWLKQAYKEKETWTYKYRSDTRRQKTLGERKAEKLAKNDLSRLADMIAEIMSDGAATLKLSNIRFTDAAFSKRNRYKPVITSQSFSGERSVPEATYNSGQDNDPFYGGDCGYTITGVHSYQVVEYYYTDFYYKTVITTNEDSEKVTTKVKDSRQVPVYGTRYNYTKNIHDKTSDGWMWSYDSDVTNNYSATSTHQVGQVDRPTTTAEKADSGMAFFTSGERTQVMNRAPNQGEGISLGAPNAGMPNQYSASGNQPGTQTLIANRGKSAHGSSELVQNNPHAIISAVQVVEGASNQMVAAGLPPLAAAVTFASDRLAGMNAEEIFVWASALSGQTDMEDLSQAAAHLGLEKVLATLKSSYQAMFGNLYQAPFLGLLFEWSLNQQAKWDEIRMSLFNTPELAEELAGFEVLKPLLDHAQSVEMDKTKNQLTIVDDSGSLHQIQIITKGFQETITGLDGSILWREFDQAGRVTSERDEKNSRTVKYVLDEQGKTSSIVVIENGPQGTMTRTYDADYRLIKEEGGENIMNYSYDNSGYQVRITNAAGEHVCTKTYAQDRLAHVEFGDGSQETYQYQFDNQGRMQHVLVEITNAQGSKVTYKYDEEGKLVGVKNGDEQAFAPVSQNQVVGELERMLADQSESFNQLTGQRLRDWLAPTMDTRGR